jgi:HD-GYP domain-containing protein (c-di-GMP phosphodiesterase class II)
VSENREEQRSHRWLARSRTGFVVSAAAFIIPFALSMVSAFTASVLLPHPSSSGQRVLWWISILAIAWGAAILGERIARPLLPLASLLKMSLLFPDRAPSRFAVAWRSGSTRQLDRYVHGLDDGVRREPVTAAAEILTLVTALSSHDRRTRGHSERVRAYTDLIADELRLPPGDRDRLRWSALLHDVGKIAVHVDILNKTGKPSETEWEILRKHPQEGQRLIEPIREWLGEWGLAVAQHHENFDGTGYPFGISGDQISLGARIVSVADAFEVMTSARSYKSAISPSAARKELTRCAATQFDPAIVRAFLNISVGRQRWVIGPLAWLFDVPIISQLGNLGNVFAVGSQVALVAGSVSLGAVAAGGQVLAHHSTHPHDLVALEASHIKRQPEVVAVLSTNSLGVAGSMHGGAKISHATRDTGGTMTYYVYGNDTCSSTGLIATLGPVKLTDGAVPNSPNWTAGPAGTYYFVAVYSGDASDDASRSGCNSDPITVVADATTITIQLSATTLTINGEIHASAAVTGTYIRAAGTVTYDVYNNNACATGSGGLVATLGPLTVTNGVASNSPNWTAAGPSGIYYFVAAYRGDASDKVAESGCGAAPVTVSSSSPTQAVSTPAANPGNPTPQPAANPGNPTPQPAPTTTTTKPPAPTTTTTKPPAPTTTTTEPPAPTTTTTEPPAPTTTTTEPPAPTTTTTTRSCFPPTPWCQPPGPPLW